MSKSKCRECGHTALDSGFSGVLLSFFYDKMNELANAETHCHLRIVPLLTKQGELKKKTQIKEKRNFT